ncbi:hypothetical protein [Terrisporobacter glycolicus]|uniref:hypothetical protein n=1 Tax=Terrisporobacter petrolearius TaxID=1460447 RepID=UPI0008F25F9F|nr:hypothetical protein SAMN02910355_1871 [Terrisporobacter glycolicus]
MEKYNCYQCGREIKTKLFRLDLGQGDMFYFHDKCLDKWIDKNIKEINLKKGDDVENPKK